MDKYKTIITKSAEETKNLGETLALDINKRGSLTPRIICLYGDLGLGKTTLVQGFAKGLGLTTRLLSPTFIIVRRYQLDGEERFFYHLDLYRIKEIQDMTTLGLEEIFADPNNIVVIEWADRLGALLPNHRLDIRLSSGGSEQKRVIKMSKYDE